MPVFGAIYVKAYCLVYELLELLGISRTCFIHYIVF